MRLKRKRLHAKAATLRTGKAEALEIAEHWYAAENHSQALKTAMQAGLSAQTAFAYPQAERAYRLALESATHLENDNSATESQQLLHMQSKHHLGEVLSATGKIQEAQELWRDIIEHAQWLPDSQELIAKAKVELIQAMRFSGDYKTALELIGDLTHTEPFYTLMCVELSNLLRRDNRSRATYYALEAVKNAKIEENQDDLVRAILSLASSTQQTQRKVILANIAVRVAEAASNHHLLSTAWNDLGVAYYNTNHRKEAFKAWTQATKYATIVGNSRILASLDVNKALIFMQDTAFDEALLGLERAIQLARRIGLQGLEKQATYNKAYCLYGNNQLIQARTEMESIKDHFLEPVARVWETRITIELGDGFVLQVPPLGENDYGYGYFQVTQALLALSFGDYQKVWEITTQEVDEADWHWALARVHAGWRLGLQDEKILKQLLNGHAIDPNLTAELTREFIEFIELALQPKTTENKTQLALLCPQYIASPIGVFARDVLLSLGDSAPN
jgi:tetratricopeptide (TPR) repeat protein